MYWNWKPPKTHHKYGHFYWIMSRDFQQCSTMAKHIITVTFCFGPYDSKSSYFSIGFSKRNEHHENPLFQYICLFKTLFAIEVIGIKGVLVACLYVDSISEIRISTFIREERTSCKNSCETDYFTLNPGLCPKILFHFIVWKHSLNLVKYWVLRNTWKSLSIQYFSKLVSYWN